jgi:hypothetical protein
MPGGAAGTQLELVSISQRLSKSHRPHLSILLKFELHMYQYGKVRVLTKAITDYYL